MTSQTDGAIKKVAMCSALVAGFAYVGYKVVRNFKNRKGNRREGESF